MSDSVWPHRWQPPGSPVPGILQARTLEWVAISFSNAWKWKVKAKSLSRVRLLATPWTAAYQAPPSMGFSRPKYWSGVPLPSSSISLQKSNPKELRLNDKSLTLTVKLTRSPGTKLVCQCNRAEEVQICDSQLQAESSTSIIIMRSKISIINVHLIPRFYFSISCIPSLFRLSILRKCFSLIWGLFFFF